MFLRDPARIEGLLCCHFIAMLIQALIERTIRTAMADRGLTELSLYPEDRAHRRPRARDLHRRRPPPTLLRHGRLVQTFQPGLTTCNVKSEDLLDIPTSAYIDPA